MPIDSKARLSDLIGTGPAGMAAICEDTDPPEFIMQIHDFFLRSLL